MKNALLSLLFFGIFVFIALVSFKRPTNDRDWAVGLNRLPTISIVGEGKETHVKIENVRDSTYAGSVETISYISGDYAVNDIEKMWFLIEPFSKWKAFAHTFFIFDFKDGQTLAFSVEARKEKGEKYSPLRGLFREYELYYSYGTERDFILRRTSFLNHDLRMYPVKTTRENLEKLFVSIAERALELETKPTFYNTITSSCTTTLVKHINETSPGKIQWWQPEQYIPGLSDRLAYSLDLFDTKGTFEEAQKRYTIKELANNCSTENNFSSCLRRGLEDDI